MGDFATVTEAYRAKIATGELEPDEAQACAVEQFAALEKALAEYFAPQQKSFLWKTAAQSKSAPKGLYIHGGVGRGKSLLMDLFHAATAPLYPARRVHFHAFMHEVHHLLEEKRQLGITDPLPVVADQIIAQSRLICFDEFFVQDIADAMILGRLFALLFARGVVVVATSNIAIENLYLHGLQRARFLPFIDMLKQHMHEHLLQAGQDYRRHSLDRLPRYFTPQNDEEYHQAYKTLIAHLPQSLLRLSVYNRLQEFPDFHRDILRTDFSTLCDQPMGSADYLQIAQAVRILFLDSVPRLSGADNDSRARRFLYLIDCLYDAQCQLFMQMHQPLNELYRNGKFNDEFRRCQSRLQEMQTSDYTKKSQK